MIESIRKRSCRHRVMPTRWPESLPEPAPLRSSGGGSGGGSDDGGKYEAFDGTYGIAASKIAFVSRPAAPPADDADYAISLIAVGEELNGKVEVRGTQGVRISSGPPGTTKGAATNTEGVEIAVDDEQNIRLKRGLTLQQKVTLDPGEIVVDGGTGTVTISSVEEIKLQVGPNSIVLDPQGITIKGILVNIN